MLEWASPAWFLALPLAVILPWLVGRPRVAFSDLRAVQIRRSVRSLGAQALPLLASAGLACLVVAMARPQDVDRERIRESEGIDIMLALDTSQSMEALDYQLGGRDASRLEVAKEVIAQFVEGRPDDRIGLVVFGEEALTQVPLTLDHDAMLDFLGRVQIGMVGGRATAVGDGLAIGLQRLEDLEGSSRILILLTDGSNNAGTLKPLEAAEAAKALGIRVYTIGVGSSTGRSGFFGMRRRSDLDERSLQAIAKITDGRYFRAGDARTLAEVYTIIDALEVSTAEVKELVNREERFHGWLFTGLGLLLLQLLLGESLLRRLP